MKKVLLVLLILLLPVVGYFSYGLINKSTGAQKSSVSSAKELLFAKNLIDLTLKEKEAALTEKTAHMKADLRSDRTFILDYFVDKSMSSKAVRSVGKRYATLLGLSQLSCTDETGYQFSSFGESLKESGIDVSKEGVVISTTDTLSESGSRIILTAGELVSFDSLKKLVGIFNAEILLMDGSKALYTSLSDEVQNFGPKEDGTVILNDEIYVEQHFAVNDRVVLYCLKKQGE